VKGGSEAGNVGAPPAILNAIIDALSDWGLRTSRFLPRSSASGRPFIGARNRAI
jgi:hypothetical protein